MARIKVEDWLTEDSLLKLKNWAAQGYTDLEIYRAIHIGKTTFYKWCKEHPQIKKAIDLGRAPVILEIEESFLNSCRDRFVAEETKTKKPDGSIEVKQRKKFVPARTGSTILYLRNKDPDNWLDPKEKVLIEKTKLENERLKAEIEVTKLKAKALEASLEGDNEQLDKVDKILKEIEIESIKLKEGDHIEDV